MSKLITLDGLSHFKNKMLEHTNNVYATKSDLDSASIPYAIVKNNAAEEGSASTYRMVRIDKDGNYVELENSATINIPKDMVVESGEVKECTEDNVPVEGYVVGNKYIDLVLANSDDQHLYINVSDLIDVHNVGKNVEGQTFNVRGTTITAKAGAEIFNQYDSNLATGSCSHAEGNSTIASGDYSHSEGAGTYASGNGSHTEGGGTQASGDYSHAEGNGSNAKGNNSHAEGSGSTASGAQSHAEGYASKAEGENSHAEGQATVASSVAQHVQGKYNVEDTSDKYAFIIGNGDSTTRSNAFAVDWDGKLYINNSEEGVDVADLSTRVATLEAQGGSGTIDAATNEEIDAMFNEAS